jgi:K+-sensing histidine kinase KdpD
MRRGAGYILRLRPWSVSAFAMALLAVVLAAFLQGVLASSLGSTLHFVGFYPAILVVSLFAGIPAGVFAATLTIPIVWWAFMPPYFEFNPLTVADYNGFSLFLLSSALAIWLSKLYREGLVIFAELNPGADVQSRARKI